MPRISAKLTLAVILLLATIAVAAGCKPKEAKAPAVPPGPPPTGQTAAPGELAQPGGPATEAPTAAQQPVSVAGEIVFKCGDITLGMPLADIRAKYATANNTVKDQWVTPDDTGMMAVLLGIKGKTSAPDAGGRMEQMNFFFKGGKLVAYYHAGTGPAEAKLDAWIKQNGAGLPAPGTALPDFAKAADICGILLQTGPDVQNAIWANETAKTLLGAHLEPGHILVEVLLDVPQYMDVMEKVRQAPPAKTPGGEAPPPPGPR